MHVASVEKACGAHGKVEDIVIKVQKNVAYENRGHADAKTDTARKAGTPRPVRTEEEIMDILVEIRVLTGVSTQDAKIIAEKADYDLDLIKEKYKIAKGQDIENLAGWLIKAIENDYQAPVRKPKKVDPGFTERKYTTEDYEKMFSSVS